MASYPKIKASNGDKPKVRAQLTKEYMVEYAILNGTGEQRATLKKVFTENKEVKKNKISNGKTFDSYKMKPIRETFCQLFFPELCEKPKKKREKKKVFKDIIDEL